MTKEIDYDSPLAVRNAGLEALKEALGPIGVVKFVEQFRGAHGGDFTKEKYDRPDVTIEEVEERLRAIGALE